MSVVGFDSPRVVLLRPHGRVTKPAASGDHGRLLYNVTVTHS
jgi:hypothetical protein